MFLDAAPTPAPTLFTRLLAHLRRRRFLYLALLLHAAPLAVLYGQGSRRVDAAALQRRQQAVAAGERLTADARLARRVHDMARIKSLLEEAAGKAAAGKTDDVQFNRGRRMRCWRGPRRCRRPSTSSSATPTPNGWRS
jgi:hypothetical protein